MSAQTCPLCTLDDILELTGDWECATCGYEWPKEATTEVRTFQDAHGAPLVDGDSVVLIKDLKLKGGSGVLKGGTKVRNIRLVDADHDIDCRIDGIAMALKSSFVKKA